jgi:hypothetical protein
MFNFESVLSIEVLARESRDLNFRLKYAPLGNVPD